MGGGDLAGSQKWAARVTNGKRQMLPVASVADYTPTISGAKRSCAENLDRNGSRLYEALTTLAACGPFWPSVISNSTGSPSCRLLYPSELIAL